MEDEGEAQASIPLHTPHIQTTHNTMEASYTILMGRGSRVGINDLSGEAQASIMLYMPYTQTTSVMEACHTISMGKGSRVGMDDLKAIHLHDSSVLMVVHH